MRTFAFVINQKTVIVLNAESHQAAFQKLLDNDLTKDGDTLQVYSVDGSESAFIKITLEVKTC